MIGIGTIGLITLVVISGLIIVGIRKLFRLGRNPKVIVIKEERESK